MSKSEYLSLRRFAVSQEQDFGDFLACLRLPEGTLFACWTMQNTLAYLCITDRLDHFLFDLCECDASGEPVRFAYRFYSVTLREIATRLYEGDWRFCNA